MRTLVTGAAGFIGSHLTERLVGDGHQVVAVDSLTDYYDPALKAVRLDALVTLAGVTVVRADVRQPVVLDLLADIDVVFHLAGQPGVRASWEDFPSYSRQNVEVTHALLEATRPLRRPPKIVLASSSSVYGNAEVYPCREDGPTRPISPYGVSKLAMERLAAAYVSTHRAAVTVLRYFTVYGPRQRPDMAFTRFIDAALVGEPVRVFGNGEQVRQFTYVADVVEGTVRAGAAELEPGTTINLCGGAAASVNEVLQLIGELVGTSVDIRYEAAAAGDVGRTGGVPDRALRLLGWTPGVALADGLAHQVASQRATQVRPLAHTA